MTPSGLHSRLPNLRTNRPGRAPQQQARTTQRDRTAENLSSPQFLPGRWSSQCWERRTRAPSLVGGNRVDHPFEGIPRVAQPRHSREMSVATPTAADLDPEAGGLIEDARARASERLAARDSRATLFGALAFVAVAVPFAFLAPSDRAVEPGVLLLLVVAYALAARVEFEVGSGFAVPTQIVFVPMLFLLPVGLVPLCVAVGFLLCSSARLRAQARPRRARAAGGVQRLARARARARPRARRRAGADLGRAAAARARARRAVRLRLRQLGRPRPLAFDVPVRAQLRLTAPVYFVDAALAPAGFLFAVVAYDEPLAILLVVPLARALRLLRARAAQPDRPRARARATRTAARRSCSATSSRPTTPTPAATAATSSSWSSPSSAELGLDARSQQDAELTALLHDVGKIRIPAEIINKPGKLTDEEWAVMKTHTVEGERMLAQIGGLLGRVGHLVRSCHERWDGKRLSGRPRRRGHPARRAHRVRLRRLQRDDDRPPVPRGPLGRGGARTRWRSAPARSSTPRSSPPSGSSSAGPASSEGAARDDGPRASTRPSGSSGGCSQPITGKRDVGLRLLGRSR